MTVLITDSAIKPAKHAKILVQLNYVVFMHSVMQLVIKLFAYASMVILEMLILNAVSNCSYESLLLLSHLLFKLLIKSSLVR